MKKLAILAASILGIAQFSSAAPVCGSGTLFSYVGLGAGGCTIGTDTLYGFQVLPGTTGATELAASSILLAPLGGTANPGLTTTVTVASAAGLVQESLFTYSISGSFFIGSSLILSNSSETGDGAVTGLQDICLGGSFGPDGMSGCANRVLSLATVDGAMNADSIVFRAFSILGVTNDLTIDGGTGSAKGATFVNQFTTAATIPEPMSLVLTGIGVAFVAIRRFRFTR